MDSIPFSASETRNTSCTKHLDFHAVSFQQLFGIKVWLRGIAAGIFGGHGVGRMTGDGFRMPGVFLLDRGKIVSQFYAQSAADRPNYLAIAGLSDIASAQPSLSLMGSRHDLAAQL